MSEATRSLAKEMEGSITCWNSMIQSNSNKIHLVYSLESDDITFFNLMRYFPVHLQKNSVRVPICVYCVEHTEMIPFLKKESKLDFDEFPYAILYEHNGTYHQYTGPRLEQHDDMEDIVKWIQGISNRICIKDTIIEKLNTVKTLITDIECLMKHIIT